MRCTALHVLLQHASSRAHKRTSVARGRTGGFNPGPSACWTDVIPLHHVLPLRRTLQQDNPAAHRRSFEVCAACAVSLAARAGTCHSSGGCRRRALSALATRQHCDEVPTPALVAWFADPILGRSARGAGFNSRSRPLAATRGRTSFNRPARAQWLDLAGQRLRQFHRIASARLILFYSSCLLVFSFAILL